MIRKRLVQVFAPLLLAPIFGGLALAEDDDQYEELVQLFQEFRVMTGVTAGDVDLIPVVSPDAIQAEALALKVFQKRLRDIRWSEWSVSKQIDYHLIRAEMNGLEFRHRVTKSWFRDPGIYSDMVLFLGERIPHEPKHEDFLRIRKTINSIPNIYSQAIINLRDVDNIPSDLADLAIRDLENGVATFNRLTAALGQNEAKLAEEIELAAKSNGELLAWLKEHRPSMIATAGIGRENYNWLLKNVYLFPYTWEELRTIVELEDNRVIAFQKLEENRNEDIPRIKPVQSQAEYKASVAAAIDDIMEFLHREEIFTMPDYLTPDGYFGSWHGFDRPWPDRHDYFFNFSHREPRIEEVHEMVGHHFDQLRGQNSTHPIRKGWRPYKISTARTEGFAFALEELLMHAGYLDQRTPRAREIAYEQAAFRTVRALSDIYMHDNQWSLEDAMTYSVANAPHGELLNDSAHLWFEMATTLRGVGHHMLMVVGKVQFMKLLRDRSQQLGDMFKLEVFMDEFFASGLIPIALIRWEMTGYRDEIDRLLME